MKITVSGRHIDVGDALRGHVESKLGDIIEKYLDRVTDASVVFTKDDHLHRASVVVNTGTHSNIVITSQAESNDVYAAFDAALAKAEKQLRRYKERLKDHHKAKPGETMADIAELPLKHYVLSGEEEVEKHDDAPLVIAEKNPEIERLTVSEAVMRMDLADLPALMFFNKKLGRVNLVYRRPDGNISWVDVEHSAA